MSIIDKTTIENTKAELASIDTQLADPKIYSSPESSKLINRQRDLNEKLGLFEQYLKTEDDINTASEMLSDPEMKTFAEEEIAELNTKLEELHAQVQLALIPKDPNDTKNAIIEIRAGAGGDAGQHGQDCVRRPAGVWLRQLRRGAERLPHLHSERRAGAGRDGEGHHRRGPRARRRARRDERVRRGAHSRRRATRGLPRLAAIGSRELRDGDPAQVAVIEGEVDELAVRALDDFLKLVQPHLPPP